MSWRERQFYGGSGVRGMPFLEIMIIAMIALFCAAVIIGAIAND